MLVENGAGFVLKAPEFRSLGYRLHLRRERAE
jgi:hypothetical protein